MIIDFLLGFGLSNLCLSTTLAIAAWACQRWTQRAGIAYLLWLLVLVKLVTPPLFTLPVIEFSGAEPAGVSSAVMSNTAAGIEHRVGNLDTATTPGLDLVAFSQWMVGLWLVGSLVLAAWSIRTIYRFQRILTRSATKAPVGIQRITSELSQKLGLAREPEVLVTQAELSPMVWWALGRAKVVLPLSLLVELPRPKLRLILAHELGHIRRGDHYVRALELLCTLVFWWNPVTWWARSGLRFNEELCCDALVISALETEAEHYADSLLSVVECLANPGIRPPALASGVTSGGSFERRLRMIISKAPHGAAPRWVQASLLLCALGILPLGLADAQVKPKTGKQEVPAERRRVAMELLKLKHEAEAIAIKTAVMEGRITAEEGKKKLEFLRREMAEKSGKGKAAPRRKLNASESYERVKQKIDSAVAAGKLTPKEGRRKLALYAEKMAKQQARSADVKRQLEGQQARLQLLREKIKAAEDAGKLTHEEAEEKLRYMERKLAELKAKGTDTPSKRENRGGR